MWLACLLQLSHACRHNNALGTVRCCKHAHWNSAKLHCLGTNQRRSAFLLQACHNQVMKTVEELWLDSLDYSSVFKHLGSYGPLASVSAAAVTVSARGRLLPGVPIYVLLRTSAAMRLHEVCATHTHTHTHT